MDYQDAIAEALAESTASDAPTTTDEVLDNIEEFDADEETTDMVDDSEDEDGEGDDSEEQDETDSEDDGEPEVYEVKVNGETVEVTLDEALEGYMRQADYTRKTQAMRKELEAELAPKLVEYEQRAQVADIIDTRFNTDPVGLIGDFFTNAAGDPSDLYLEVTKELIGLGALSKDIMDFFKIDENQQKVLAKNVEDRRRATARELSLREKEQKFAPLEKQEEEATYVASVDAAFGEFADSKSVSAEDRQGLRVAVLQYMAENEMYEIADVKRAARIVLKEQELARKEQELAAKPKPARKATQVARPSRRSTTIPSAKPQTLEDDIRAALRASVQQS